jgi:hypothetical protein
MSILLQNPSLLLSFFSIKNQSIHSRHRWRGLLAQSVSAAKLHEKSEHSTTPDLFFANLLTERQNDFFRKKRDRVRDFKKESRIFAP